MRPWVPAACGASAALLWLLFVLRWFDAAQPWRPAALQAVWPALLAAALAAAAGAWLWLRRTALMGPVDDGPVMDAADRRRLWLVVALAVAFRLPLAIQGGAGYLTPDGALSGIVALRLHEGSERLVFVPQVAYSGSLKSHVAAALMPLFDPARAFALASLLFYGLFVGALFHLAWTAARQDRAWTATAAGVYAAFAPAFLTRYSLSNDGNYVEVLALGTLALLAALRWRQATESPGPPALVTGLCLGLAFWCHVLALVYILAIGSWMLAVAPRRALRATPRVAGGFALGVWPSLVWNAGHGWETLRHIVPGGDRGEGSAQPFPWRVDEIVTGQWPVLLGYDPGHPAALDLLLRVLALSAAAALVWAVAAAVRERPRRPAVLLLLALLGSNLALALLALRVIEGNPRYLLFSMAAVPVLLARVLEPRRRRWAMAALVAVGAAGSLLQAPGALRADAQWRAFVGDLEAAGVRFCHTDFYLATKINFLSGERIICSAKLGPTITEYFAEYRRDAEAAPEAALIAVNTTNAEKLERRLQRAGVSYQRLDLMKPVLLRFSRPVDPSLLFPDREFGLR